MWVSDWLTHRAAATPDTTVLATVEGDAWTAAELDAEVETTAGRLAAWGVGSGDHVGVLMENRPAFVRLVFAAHRLGCVLVPLNARLASAELVVQADRADLDALVCEAETRDAATDVARETPARVLDVDRTASSGMSEAVRAPETRGNTDVRPFAARGEDAFEAAAWSLSDPCLFLFTSGTTGDPKPVALTHGNLLASAAASAFRLGVLPDDRWLCVLSMYHMGGLAVVLRSVLYGTTAVLQRDFDPAATREALADCTGVSLVPVLVRRLLDAGDVPDSLRFVLAGGAPTPVALVERCGERDVPICPTYGMTETASQVATATPDEATDHPGSVGRPLVGVGVAVVDESGAELPRGEVGELVVSGPTVAAGYYDDPAATREAFRADGLHTGDVGYRDEAGRLSVLNRRTDRIVTGGENVHPGEVVDVLRNLPGVRDAAVVGLADPEWGERVAALVVPEADADLTAAAVREHCETRLAGFKRPRTVAFADALPRTASGTVEREAVRERLRRAADL